MSSEMPENPGAINVNIELTEDVAEGHYCNMAFITHSNAEFIVDFIKIMPGVTKARVKSRIILTPQHAKRLVNALSENIAQYESVHGEIPDSGPAVPPGGIPMNFGGQMGQA
ncbi:MAG: DUF3467 domain-containing protein [Flavobacteriales bacterium]|nr:DUF3467 domain-containing protein [Flavobacteriales bacterium]MCX7650420.1 DUF3467 domain-containing protein [Flavobacteriales bacterium]MDW8431688.1 DUF3467 domain-containing protein [Flavobacteriales bacterium]